MKTPVVRTGLLVALFIAAFGVSAEVYKWTDETGRVHFSDRPVGEDAEELKIKSKPTDKAALAQAKQDKLDAEQAAAAQAQIDKEQNDEKQANAAIRAENCARSKEALNSVINAQRLYKADENGERQYLSQVEIFERIQRAEKDVYEWCNDKKDQNQVADRSQNRQR